VLVASAAFTIPFGRMTESKNPLASPEHCLSSAIKRLKKKSFLDAPFWNGVRPRFFRYATIAANPENSILWRNASNVHPLRSEEDKDGKTILLTIRRALAHGNIVYLDKRGYEAPGNRLIYLAFLSNHDSGTGYRVVIFDEESFLQFVKSWIVWLQTFPHETELIFAEAAD
jgi:hypothetical protein